MDPLTLALLGYPLSILASFTYDQLKKISQRVDVDPLKDLFLEAFFTSLKYHDKYYDKYSKKVVGGLRKAVRKDEDKLLAIFSEYSDDFDEFLSLVKSRKFQEKVAEEIINKYSLDLGNYPRLMGSIITDCLNHYLYAFFNQMNEKEGIQAILIECLKLDSVLDLLKQIDSRVVTKNDFDELRRIVLLNHFNENEELRKRLKDYDQYLRNKFKYIELRGFSPKISGKEIQMGLLDIFVPLEIDIDKSIMPNILEEKMLPLQRSLEIDNPKKEDDKKKNPIASILKDRCLVILGDPGSGKSTFLKYLAMKVTYLRNSKGLLAKTIPLYIRISDYADYFKKEKRTLYEFITEHYDKQYQHIFKEGFEYSNLLLLMDGLDEITDTPLRIRVTDQVMDLIARYPYNRYVVTSRIVGYQESKLGGDFRHFKLMPFELDEIKLFSEQWYKCIALHTNKDYNHAKKQANSLSFSISRNPSVVRLATNPLLMTIIAMIHYKGKRLPNKRVELYDVSTETFLEYWVQLRMDDRSQLKDKSEIIEILAPIAFEIHQNKSKGLIEEKEFVGSFLWNFRNIHTNTSDEDAKKECREFIDFLREQAGFFYEKGVDDEGNRFYGFIHLTFEEYLAAIELVSKWNEGKLDLKNYVFNPRWIEVIRLGASQLRLSYKGRAGRVQLTQFVKDILSVEDPFSEAYRPLQLACLILSDDVNIMDELLNEILDKIIEIVSKRDFTELIESFSKLFKEVLYSDYRYAFIDRFEKEVLTGNSTVLNNLIYILVFNSSDKVIDKILISLLNKNEKVLKAIYQIQWRDFPFQNSEVYKENFKNYLSYLKSQNDEEGLRKASHEFMAVTTKEQWWGWIWRVNLQKIISTIDQFPDTQIFDILLAFILRYILNSYLRSGVREGLDILLRRYSDDVLIKSLNKSLDKINLDGIRLSDYSRGAMFELEHYSVLLKKGAKDLQLWLWSRSYDELFYYSMSSADISGCLENLKSRFSESDIEVIERSIYEILGPQEGADTENTTRFTKAYESGKLYDFFGWEGFPLTNVASNPSILSKIIVQHGQRYTDRPIPRRGEKIEKWMNLKDFDNEHICPPAKLLAYYYSNKPFDRKLLEESIVYFRDCSSKEKKGAFSILYKILNPFELT